MKKDEAQILIKKFIKAKKRAKRIKTEASKQTLRTIENECINKFKFLVYMRTAKYRGFSNYEDLNQEGLLALSHAMQNYDPTKSSFCYWALRYIETRIARSANTHTTIRFPMRYAKINTPYRETKLPKLLDVVNCPDKMFEASETASAVRDAMGVLAGRQKKIVELYFGFDGNKPMNISRICKAMKIQRNKCLEIISNALEVLKGSIKI